MMGIAVAVAFAVGAGKQASKKKKKDDKSDQLTMSDLSRRTAMQPRRGGKRPDGAYRPRRDCETSDKHVVVVVRPPAETHQSSSFAGPVRMQVAAFRLQPPHFAGLSAIPRVSLSKAVRYGTSTKKTGHKTSFQQLNPFKNRCKPWHFLRSPNCQGM